MDLTKLLLNIDPATSLAILVVYFLLRERLIRIEERLGINERDVDGLASVIGTARSKSRKKKEGSQ